MMRVFSFNRIVVAASMLAAVGLTGCTSSQPSVDDEDEVAEDSAALEDSSADPDATEAKEARRGDRGGHGMRGGPGMRGRGPGGPEMFLFRAAEDLDLTDAQRTTLEAAQDEMRPGRDGKGPRPEKMAELAAAVRKGSVDVAALAPPAGTDPMKDHRAKSVAAIQKLHDTLTPAQRKELVAAVQAKMADHGDREGRPDAGERGAKGRGPGAGGGRMNPTSFLLHGIDVSDAQQAKITAALEKAGLGANDAPEPPAFSEMKAKAEAGLAAFAKDQFDAATALPQPPAGKTQGGPKRFVESLAVIVPLLDADQREELAQRIEQGPPGHHGRKGPRAPEAD